MGTDKQPMRWEPTRRRADGVVTQRYHAASGKVVTQVYMPGRCVRVFWGAGTPAEEPQDFWGVDAWGEARAEIERRFAVEDEA